MALFKNLYLDLSYLNPFKGTKPEKKVQAAVVFSRPQVKKTPEEPVNYRELPAISKRLLEEIHEKGPSQKKYIEHKASLHSLLDKELKEPQKPQSIKQPEHKIEPKPVEVVSVPVEKEPAVQYSNSPASSQNDENNSFFKSLHSHLSKEESYLHNATYSNLVNNDLFEGMQGFWHNKKEEMNKTAFNNAIKNDLMKKMSDLQTLEVDWQKLQLQHDRLKDELSSKEMVIEHNTRHLKKSFKKLHFNLAVNPEHYFVLSDGKKLKNLQDLYENVKHMDNEVFYKHVNENKNDFSSWINDIMGIKELASAIKSAKTREEHYHSIDNWYNSA